MDVWKSVIKILGEYLKKEYYYIEEDYNKYLRLKVSSKSENDKRYYSTFVDNTKKNLDTVRVCLAKLKNIDDNTLNLSLKEDLGIDSLNMLEIVIILEEEFNIEFPNSFDELDSFVYIKDIVNYIENKLK